jgi:hypothetical protein
VIAAHSLELAEVDVHARRVLGDRQLERATQLLLA